MSNENQSLDPAVEQFYKDFGWIAKGIKFAATVIGCIALIKFIFVAIIFVVFGMATNQ